MSRALTLALATALSLTACAADKPVASSPAKAAVAGKPAAIAAFDEAAVRAALEGLAPGIAIDRIRVSEIPGFAEVAVSGRAIYVSNDGKLLLQGTLIDVATRENITDRGMASLRAEALAKVGADRRIVFAPEQVKHRVTVFTDIDCGYCRKLHQHMAEFNEAGIAIEYLFFPRAGSGSESWDKAVSVWCAEDQQKALTNAKAGGEIEAKSCANPVTMDYELGRKVGVDGTPAMYAADGSHVGGYVEPKQLLARLDEIAARDSEGKAEAVATAR